MNKIDQYKEVLKIELPYLQEKYSVSEIGVFGSYVRLENKEDSDLDILVKFDEYPSLFKYLDLQQYLTEKLGVKVDLVHKDSLKKYIGKRILSEVQYL
ncbi:MAG TPA: nucleotidyltransferase family protein [Chitinophagales bacterium]|nr:nucleotidyltransferase family protein [Chitinophagales bacterium]